VFWGLGFRKIPSGAAVLVEPLKMCQHYFFKFIKNVWRCGGADLASEPIPQPVRLYTPSTAAASLLAVKKLGASAPRKESRASSPTGRRLQE
jgi:hypothetical protein